MSSLDHSLTGSIEAPDMETVEKLQRMLLGAFATLRRDGLRASEPVWHDTQEARRQAFGVAEVLDFTAAVGKEVLAGVLSEYLDRELSARFPGAEHAVHAEHGAVTVRLQGSTVVIRLSGPEARDDRTYS